MSAADHDHSPDDDQTEPAFCLPYTPDRMRWALDRIGWDQHQLARRAQINPDGVRQMARGVRPIPDYLAVWLETLARIHDTLPLPVADRRVSGGERR